MKNNQNTCWCNGCLCFIKNLPYIEGDAVFYFGKHKGIKINKVQDIGYLEWCVKNNVVKGNTLDAVKDRISELNYQTK